MTTNDDRNPSIHIEGYGKVPLDVVVALYPVLKSFRDRGLHWPKKRKSQPVGDDKPGKLQ